MSKFKLDRIKQIIKDGRERGYEARTILESKE